MQGFLAVLAEEQRVNQNEGMCLSRFHLPGILFLSSLMGCSDALAQVLNVDDLTARYNAADCGSCAAWNRPQEPFRIHGDSYYVGPHGLSSILITSNDGHILIDGALPDSAPIILDNIRKLGFDPGDIRLILNSHPHYDHAGGIAALQHASGATVAAGSDSADVLERGNVGPDDPQFVTHLAFPAVSKVSRVTLGTPLIEGLITITPFATPGHTPGGTSWTWESCDAQGCLSLVYADSISPVSSEGFRFSDSLSYPDALADFEQSFDALEQLPCDILITTHPEASYLWERLEAGEDGLVDQLACKQYAASARKRLALRLAAESEENPDAH